MASVPKGHRFGLGRYVAVHPVSGFPCFTAPEESYDKVIGYGLVTGILAEWVPARPNPNLEGMERIVG